MEQHLYVNVDVYDTDSSLWVADNTKVAGNYRGESF